MPKILHLASIWKVCFHFNFTKFDPSYFFEREFFLFGYIHLFLNSVNMVKKLTIKCFLCSYQIILIFIWMDQYWHLIKKKCTFKSINIVYQKMSYSILVKSMANMIHIIIVFILIQIWFFIICRLLKFITLIWIALIFFLLH